MIPAKGSLAALRAATAAHEERRAADARAIEAAALARAEAERAAASELNAAARALSDFEQELTQARQNFTLRVAVCDTLQLDLCRGVLTRVPWLAAVMSAEQVLADPERVRAWLLWAEGTAAGSTHPTPPTLPTTPVGAEGDLELGSGASVWERWRRVVATEAAEQEGSRSAAAEPAAPPRKRTRSESVTEPFGSGPESGTPDAPSSFALPPVETVTVDGIVFRSFQTEDAMRRHLSARAPPVVAGGHEPLVGRCWGDVVSGGALGCEALPPQASSFRERFCGGCRQRGVFVLASRVCVPIGAGSDEIANRHGRGFWNEPSRASSLPAHRVVNQTSDCPGPTLVILKDELPGPLPTYVTSTPRVT
ncbi:hypothetical protein EMIHUDRAFT_369968 [Emiliania huxleyi CCMP1516]|uniref:Uncharacterized protein n=2 Tax=Emiliania huxleyi TaxID=2903 RepID=A0A0D3J206_EMIH1|nr:hypothetical protein EMIHUDRAFT_369968 [Emiliania huxleyi CCMP1516]EOD17541.1 hypothetical protein EMIHUDRAFT_369968 [Emiliania huxleyi CCMP1516]|eukprot:XP_005769970.1 hypothetical protein EMIHUDRAFT_369968 [Emiliania huxleyi CCMP1516]